MKPTHKPIVSQKPTPELLSVDDYREQVTGICLGLLGAATSGETGQHTAFEVARKRFAYFLVDHHGDGRIALNCKVAPGRQQSLVAAQPARFFVPAYLGVHGWVGLDLEAAPFDQQEVRALVTESYRLVAPRCYAALV